MELIKTPAGDYTPDNNTPIREVNVDFSSRNIPEILRLTQYDTQPVIAVHLYYNGEQYTVPDGAAVNIRLRKHDDKPVYNPALGVSKDRHTVYIQVTDQMSVVDGDAKAVIEVISGGKIAGTAKFVAEIDKNPVQQNDIISQAEFRLLMEYVADAEAAAKSAGESAEAAAADRAAADKSAENASGSEAAAKKALEETEAAAERAESARDEAVQLEEQTAEHEAAARESAGTAAADALRAEEAAELAHRIAQGSLGYYATEELLREKHPEAEDGNWAIVGSTDTIWVWDSDKREWTDSSNKTALAQYYTRAETDELLTGLEESMDAKVAEATSKTWTLTVPASGWERSTATWEETGHKAKWSNTVAADGVTPETDLPLISRAGGDETAYGQMDWYEGGDGVVIFYCDRDATPGADFVVKVTEVR